jgi:hypothetical protein
VTNVILDGNPVSLPSAFTALVLTPAPKTSSLFPLLLAKCIFAYTVLLACFKIVEEAVVSIYHGRSFAESMAGFAGGSWKGLLYLTVVLFVVLIPFFAFGELRRVFGNRIVEAFVRPRHSLNLPPDVSL